MDLLNIMTVVLGAFCGFALWTFLSDLSQRLRWNPAWLGAGGMCVPVGLVWIIRTWLERKPQMMETEHLWEVFATWTIIGYVVPPLRMIVEKLGGGKTADAHPLSLREYCCWLTLALGAGLIIFGGLGIPSSLMQYGAGGMMTIVALVTGAIGGALASQSFNRQRPVEYPGHRMIVAASPLPFTGPWTFALLLGSAASTFAFY